MKVIVKYLAVFIIIVISVLFVSYNLLKSENGNYRNKNDFTLNVIDKDSFWVYEISNKNITFIRQDYIPVVAGKYRFKSKKDAEIIGSIVLKRLSDKKPPIITRNDLIIHNIKIDKI